MSWWDGLAPLVHVADSCGSGPEVEMMMQGHFASTKNKNQPCSLTDDEDTLLCSMKILILTGG